MNRRRRWWIAVCAVFGSAVAALSVGAVPGLGLSPCDYPTYYDYYVVQAYGNDGNPGTCEAPFATIDAAMTAVGTQTGKDVFVGAGSYGRIDCTGHSGSSTAHNTIVASPIHGYPELVTLYANDDWNEVVDLDCNYFEVKGFHITGHGDDDGGAAVDIEGDFNLFTRNEVEGAICQGIFTWPQAQENAISRNDIHDNGMDDPSYCHALNDPTRPRQSHGLYIQGTENLAVNNIVYDNYYGSGIHNYTSDNTPSPGSVDNVILYNTLAHNGWGQSTACNFCGHGLVIDKETNAVNTGTVAVGNIVYENRQHGLDFGNGGDPINCAVISHTIAKLNNQGDYDGTYPPPTSCYLPPSDPNSTNKVAGCTSMGFTNYNARNFHLGGVCSTPPTPVDTGDSTYCPSEDYDGYARPQNSVCDRGAFERPPPNSD